jgi:hypothetical protein
MMNERIAALANYPLKGWEINFYKSFKDAETLTAKQEETLCKIEQRYNSGISAKRAAWIAAWDEDKRNKFIFAHNLYRDRNLTARKYRIRYNDFFKSVGDPSFIPEEKDYKFIVENKYVQKSYAAFTAAAKYSVGDIVYVVAFGTKRVREQAKDRWVGVVQSVDNTSVILKKGMRNYFVMPLDEGDVLRYVGSDGMVPIKENCLTLFKYKEC